MYALLLSIAVKNISLPHPHVIDPPFYVGKRQRQVCCVCPTRISDQLQTDYDYDFVLMTRAAIMRHSFVCELNGQLLIIIRSSML